jgi:glycosyltransferase involved in cell wall biosynthesis
MKIAILVSGFPPDRIGGMEIASYNIAKHLADNGHSIHVITSSYSKYHLNKDKFAVHTINMMGTKIIGPFFDQRKILPIIKEINPEIIHAQGISTSGISGFTAFLIKNLLKIPYVVYGRGGDVYPFKAEKILVKAILNEADSIIALTKSMKKEMQKISAKEISVIPNGIDIDRFNDSSPKFSESLDTKIIFVGNLRPEKGVSYLIEAIGHITKKYINSRLLIVGEGPQKENLEKLVNKLNINNRVIFSGKVTTDEVPVYLKNSDIFVLPSLQEGFPNVLLEAMASGLPVVATDVNGINEIIEDIKNGFLVQSKNSEEIAKKILLLINNNDLRKNICDENRKKAAKYSWQRTVQMLEDVYEAILKRSF